MLDDKSILDVLNRIFKEKFCDESIEINLETTSDDILEWNSFVKVRNRNSFVNNEILLLNVCSLPRR